MASRGLECFVTPEEYRPVVKEVIESKGWLVTVRINGPNPGARVVSLDDLDPNRSQTLLAFPGDVPQERLLEAIDCPAPWGGVVLWWPHFKGSVLKHGGVGVKSHWWEGDTQYESPLGLETFQPLRKALDRLLIGRTVLIDRGNSKAGKGSLKYSDGALKWVESGGSLDNESDSQYFYKIQVKK